MARYILGWRAASREFFVEVAVHPVTAAQAAEVERVVAASEVEALLRQLEEGCSPPWCVVVEVEARDLEEARARARGWHFT